MVILVYSPIFELSEIIAEGIEELGETCFTFRNTSLLMDYLNNCRHLPDLLVLDYTTFNHEFYDLRKNLIELHTLFPLIYFNDPCPVYPDRAYHWKEQMKLLFEINDNELLEYYFRIFKKIQKTIENPDLLPYIPLLQPPLPFPEHPTKTQNLLTKLKSNNSIAIYNFKKNNKLPENLFYLLEIFYKHQGTSLSLQEIIEIFNSDKKKIKESSLRVAISKLNKAFSEDKDCNFFLQKKDNKYQVVFN